MGLQESAPANGDRTDKSGRVKLTSDIILYPDLLGFLAALAICHVLKIHLLPALALSILRVVLRHLLHSSDFRVVRVISKTRLRAHKPRTGVVASEQRIPRDNKLGLLRSLLPIHA